MYRGRVPRPPLDERERYYERGYERERPYERPPFYDEHAPVPEDAQYHKVLWLLNIYFIAPQPFIVRAFVISIVFLKKFSVIIRYGKYINYKEQNVSSLVRTIEFSK